MGLLQSLNHRTGAMQLQAMLSRVARDNIAFDAKYGVDTASQVLLDDYDVSDEAKNGAQPYQGVHEGVLRAIIGALGEGVSSFDFIDIGSGKGKALLVASTYPFRRVRGVELSPRLHEAAERNIRIFATSSEVRCADVSSVCRDGRSIDNLEGPTLVFLANPFGESLMAELVAALEHCVRRGAPILVSYLVPRARGPFDASPLFRLLLESNRLCVYASFGVELAPSACAALVHKFNTWSV